MTPPDSDPKNEPDPASDEPIFKFKKKVDDDWKRKVEEEKERLSEAPPRSEAPRPEAAPSAPAGKPSSSPSPAASGSGPAAGESPSEGEFEDERSGAASTPFLRFIGDLANQALTALGAYPDPLTRTRQVSLEQARYIIDVLRILKDKTKGNLTSDEQRVVDGLLYELQLQFVEMNR